MAEYIQLAIEIVIQNVRLSYEFIVPLIVACKRFGEVVSTLPRTIIGPGCSIIGNAVHGTSTIGSVPDADYHIWTKYIYGRNVMQYIESIGWVAGVRIILPDITIEISMSDPDKIIVYEPNIRVGHPAIYRRGNDEGSLKYMLEQFRKLYAPKLRRWLNIDSDDFVMATYDY